jgi:hypothetical protein
MSAQLPRPSASAGAASGPAVICGRDASRHTQLESARAYASMPPDEAEMEGVWVRWWDTAAGGAGANWATCLHLLESAAAAANVARDGAASAVASLTRVWGGCLFVPGGDLNEIKKSKKTCLPYMAADR